MRIFRISWISAACLGGFVTLSVAAGLNDLISGGENALPPGHHFAITAGEEWLPEPLQGRFFKAPSLGKPIAGCLSVMRVDVEPPIDALKVPVNLSFDCASPGTGAQPYAFIDGEWRFLPYRRDAAGRITIRVSEMTTYALLDGQAAFFVSAANFQPQNAHADQPGSIVLWQPTQVDLIRVAQEGQKLYPG